MLQSVSWLSLAATMVPSLVFLTGRVELDAAKWLMLAGTVGWFATAPLWMGRPPVAEELVL